MAFDAVTTTESKLPDQKPRLSSAQQAAVDAYWEATKARPAVPYITLRPGSESSSKALCYEDMDEQTGTMLLSQALGLNDPALLSSFISQIVTATKAREGAESFLNFAIQMIAAMEPKDPAEAMLCMQMTVVQLYFTTQSANVFTGGRPPKVEDSINCCFNRLARTFAAQMQALKVYRAKGKQQIVVKHVNVHDGGQAIVGNVETGGGGGRQAENER
jgi:hypothetical protein